MVRAGNELPVEVRDAVPQIELHNGDLADAQRVSQLVREIAPDLCTTLRDQFGGAVMARAGADRDRQRRRSRKPVGSRLANAGMLWPARQFRPSLQRREGSPPHRRRTSSRRLRQPTPMGPPKLTRTTW
jgi:hypothetical protein